MHFHWKELFHVISSLTILFPISLLPYPTVAFVGLKCMSHVVRLNCELSSYNTDETSYTHMSSTLVLRLKVEFCNFFNLCKSYNLDIFYTIWTGPFVNLNKWVGGGVRRKMTSPPNLATSSQMTMQFIHNG